MQQGQFQLFCLLHLHPPSFFYIIFYPILNRGSQSILLAASPYPPYTFIVCYSMYSINHPSACPLKRAPSCEIQASSSYIIIIFFSGSLHFSLVYFILHLMILVSTCIPVIFNPPTFLVLACFSSFPHTSSPPQSYRIVLHWHLYNEHSSSAFTFTCDHIFLYFALTLPQSCPHLVLQSLKSVSCNQLSLV